MVNRWELIETALIGRTITSSQDLELAIFSYNSKYAKSWNFRGLHTFFENELDEPETDLFFTSILPKIIHLALQLPTLIPSAIPLLKSGQNISLSMTQQQISCLMANAFLCTFPRRNTQKMNSEYKHFPDINFNRLFQSTQSSVMEKLKCVCHYFRRVTMESPPVGVVTFRRRSLPPKCIPKFSESKAEIAASKLVVRSSGTIETDGRGLLQVDFANKMIGGGVLGQGCVQEEIRFMICPELLITRLFTECLRPEEALFIIGAEQYSLYTGYASSFEWAGNYNDPTPYDGNMRRQCQIVAIDALPFKDPRHQYRTELMQRELTKAHVGYSRLQQQQRVAPGVASGNWGCGAFMGDAHLKSLLQLMVCAVANRALVYFTFGDRQLVAELEEIYELLVRKRVKVDGLWRILVKFGQRKNPNGDDLFPFITKELTTSESLFSFVPKLTAPKTGELETSVRKFAKPVMEQQSGVTIDYSEDDTDNEEGDDKLRMDVEKKKKKLSSPEGNGGPEKMAKMSLVDCLDTYFKGGCSKMQVVGNFEQTAVETANVEEIKSNVVEEEVVNKQKEDHEEVEISKFDVVVQIDEDGGEYIDASPPGTPPRDSHCTGKQTKLMDFFKRSAKK